MSRDSQFPDIVSTERWPAPAKLNLFLHVVGRRADGYHLLQTAFQFLDLCDELAYLPRPDGVVRRVTDLPNVSADQDLVVRAARALQSAGGQRMGVDIYLHKRIPMGGGLGGGSSDAATTLLALNHLWGLQLSSERLAAIGLTLGADVPVFVHGRAAWAEGIGERLTAIELEEPWFLVVMPPVQVSTAEVFRDADLTCDTPPMTIPAFLSGQGKNDLARTVCKRYPEVAEAMHAVAGYGEPRLTGSGAGVFARFEARDAAHRACSALRKAGWSAWVARALNRSPAHRLLGKQRQPD